MYDLIFLVTMTLVSPNHKTLESCQQAIREVYRQQVDPYKILDKKTQDELVEIKMTWSAPKEYRCVKK